MMMMMEVPTTKSTAAATGKASQLVGRAGRKKLKP